MAKTKAEATRPAAVDVVLVPLPAQGHLNQFFHLARLLSARGFPVHFVGSATHIRQVRDRAPGLGAALGGGNLVQFHGLPVPDFESPPPDPGVAIKFPSHIQPAFDAALHLLSPLSALVRSLAAVSRRVVIIHDSFMSFAAGAASSLPNVETLEFHSISAISGFLFRWHLNGKPPEPALEELGLPNESRNGDVTEEFYSFVHRQGKAGAAGSGRLINTCRAIEGTFVDLLCREPEWKDKKNFAIGPLHLLTVNQGVADGGGGSQHECMEWLDQQPVASVLYVSFGTTVTFSDEQLADLAAGLEASGQRFLWVLRDADRADIYAASTEESRQEKLLPSDYDGRVEGRGKVVRGWVPQLEILAHPATGAFMSHCGWNSSLESFAAGVPVLAWPMHSDQPWNTVLVERLLGVGFAVCEWVEGKEVVVPAAAISASIAKLMASEEGEAARRRARELREEIRRAMADGGSLKADVDAFVAHITR